MHRTREIAKPTLILASASARRRDILRSIGIEPIVRPADIDESVRADESPYEYVSRLAREKALGVDGEAENWILAADTIVAIGQEMLGKPGSLDDCIDMLSKLSAATHTVLTGVAVRHADKVTQVVSSTDVTMRRIEVGEAQRYWATGEPCDKAGAYAIQGFGAIFVSGIRGSYSGVVGLPIFETTNLLRGSGLLPFDPELKD